MTHIVWDWNGTLLDDHAIVVEAVNESLQDLGVAPIDSDGYREHFARPLERFYAALLGRPVGADLMHRIDEVFQKAYFARFPTAKLTADAGAAIAAAVDAGATQSIASMLRHDLLVSSVTRFGLEDRMLAVDGHRGSRVGETKEQHLLDHVARLRSVYGLESESMAVIGDITDDASAADAAGLRCVMFDGGSQRRAALEATGHPVAGSLVEAVGMALRARGG